MSAFFKVHYPDLVILQINYNINELNKRYIYQLNQISGLIIMNQIVRSYFNENMDSLIIHYKWKLGQGSLIKK